MSATWPLERGEPPYAVPPEGFQIIREPKTDINGGWYENPIKRCYSIDAWKLDSQTREEVVPA